MWNFGVKPYANWWIGSSVMRLALCRPAQPASETHTVITAGIREAAPNNRLSRCVYNQHSTALPDKAVVASDQGAGLASITSRDSRSRSKACPPKLQTPIVLTEDAALKLPR